MYILSSNSVSNSRLMCKSHSFVNCVTTGESHLAKRPSDLKQNGTQEKTPFSGRVFYALSHGVLSFVASVSFKNHWIEASDWLVKNFNQPEGGFMSELTHNKTYHTTWKGTLVFQLEDTVCLFGTLLLLDPIHFPKSEPCLLIGSVCQNGALLGTSL